jgi:hypothetical protein
MNFELFSALKIYERFPSLNGFDLEQGLTLNILGVLERIFILNIYKHEQFPSVNICFT